MKLILHLELGVRWGRERGRERGGLGWDAAPPHSALHAPAHLPGTRGNPGAAERDSARFADEEEGLDDQPAATAICRVCLGGLVVRGAWVHLTPRGDDHEPEPLDDDEPLPPMRLQIPPDVDPTAASDVYAGAICGQLYPEGRCTEPLGHTKGGCVEVDA